MTKSIDVKLLVDSISKKYRVFGDFQNDRSVTYSFDKFQTEENLHNKLSGELLALGIQCEVSIKIGRGKYSKGIKYATVKVPLQNVELSDLLTNKLQEKLGTSAKCSLTPLGLLITNIKTIHTATRLLTTFRRHKAEAVAKTALDYVVFIPFPDNPLENGMALLNA